MTDDKDHERHLHAVATEARLNSHEKICSERYADIKESFSRVHGRLDGINSELRRVLWAVLACAIALLGWYVTNYGPFAG